MIEFTWNGTRIRLSFLFFWFYAVLLLLDQSGFVLMGFWAAMIHELGHLIAFFIFHDFPEELSFEVTGIRLVASHKIVPVWKTVIQLASGSAANFLMFFVLFFSLGSINQISVFAVCHIILSFFNLLPVQALDGGKILQIISERLFSLNTAYLISKIVSWSCLIGLCLFCLIMFHFGNRNLSLLCICIWMITVCIKKKDM